MNNFFLSTNNLVCEEHLKNLFIDKIIYIVEIFVIYNEIQ